MRSAPVNEALRPIAAIAAPFTYAANAMVSLQADGSAGACGKTIASYAWSVVSGTGALTSTTAATTSILAPAAGTTVVQLIVTDNDGRADTATVTLNTTSSTTAAPVSAGAKACLTDDATVTVAASDAGAAEAGADTGCVHHHAQRQYRERADSIDGGFRNGSRRCRLRRAGWKRRDPRGPGFGDGDRHASR